MKSNKFTFLILISFCLCITALTGCSSKPYTGEQYAKTDLGNGVTLVEKENRSLLPDGNLAGQDAALMQIQAKVEKIDYTKRLLTLKDANGQSTELIVGLQVVNFDQIKSGDKVNVGYYISVAFEVRQPTAEEVKIANTSMEFASRARLGEMPAAGIAKGVVKIATVTAIDKDTDIVTLKGLSTPESLTKVKAKYAQNLANVKIGDKIVVTVTESYAAAVERM